MNGQEKPAVDPERQAEREYRRREREENKRLADAARGAEGPSFILMLVAGIGVLLTLVYEPERHMRLCLWTVCTIFAVTTWCVLRSTRRH